MILITGGSGFIGSHFHNYVKNDKIINLDLTPPFFKYQATFIQGDIRNESDVLKAITAGNIKTILLLAAKHHDFGIGHNEYFDTNEEGTRTLCRAASKYDIKEIVFFSSVAVYGLLNEVSSETFEPTPDSSYGASKLAGERVLQEWVADDPTRKVLVIRPTLVFGPYNKANMYNLIRQIDSGFYFHLGKANNIKSIAYAENLVQATLFLMERMKPGLSVYNYADEPQLTVRETTDMIASCLKKKVWLTLPKRLGELAGLPFDVLIRLTGKNFPISTARIKKLGSTTHHSARKLFNEGFSPQYSTHDGLRKMVDWYLSQKGVSK